MSAHPLVTVVRTARNGWTSRWTCPVTGKSKQQNLARLGLTTNKQRTDWAKALSAKLTLERQQVLLGAPRIAEIQLSEAVTARLEQIKDSARSTRENTRRALGLVLTAFGDRLVSSITDADLMRLRDILSQGVKPSTAALRRTLVGAFLSYCLDREHTGPRLTERGIKKLRKADSQRVPRKAQVLSPEEVRAAREKLDGIWLDLFDICILSGARIGEVEQLDLDTDVLPDCLRLRAETTKCRVQRDICFSIAPTLKDILSRYSGQPFRGKRSGLHERLARLGINGTHTLRRTTASTCLSAGLLPPYALAQRNGHSLTILLSRYASLIRPGQLKQGTTIEQVLGL